MKNQPQKINIPDGMKLEQKNDEWYFVPIEETLTSEEKLERCQKIITEYNKENNNEYFLNSSGKKMNRTGDITFNYGSKNLIKAELIQMVWRRLALKLNKEVLDFNDSSQDKYYACFSNSRIQRGFSIITNSGAVYFTEQAYDEALELIGEENLVFMFSNLNK